MSKRKGSYHPKRRDEDFNRNSNLLTTRESTPPAGERQLFNPRLDNPIAFNKSTTSNSILNKVQPEEAEPIRQTSSFSPQRRSNPNPSSSRPPPPSGRRLWNPNSNESSSPTRPEKVEIKTKTTPKQSSPQSSPQPVKVKRQADPASAHQKTVKKEVVKTKLTAEEQEKEDKRNKLKALVISLKAIENKLESIAAASSHLHCFKPDDHVIDDSRKENSRRTTDQPIDTQDTVLVEQDIKDAEKVWREKIDLHLSLGEKYLEVLKCDLEYAEKKGLESLCWKRAVYSLVDQFRRALKKSITVNNTTAAAAVTNAIASATPHQPSELEKLLMEETGEENVTEVPVINDGKGMIFIKVETPKEPQPAENDKLLAKQTRMILTLFLEYLDLADAFYQKLTLFLKSVDDEKDENMENYLSQWRRTRKYKWYSCVPIRGDIARYRLTYTPDTDIDQNSMEYDELTPVTTWTQKQAFEETWKRYFLGVWLMPAKGNLYFNLSLSLQPTQSTPGYEFHKLYLSTRSLMVRRNGFLNARESMLALFESNRRWISKNLELDSNSKQKRRQQPKIKPTLKSAVEKDAIVPALFIRLHGMLFTKIGLDGFSQVKRQFFDALFVKIAESSNTDDEKTSLVQDSDELHEKHLFWLETIIISLSSLYTYDYANSRLTKLISSNSNKLFYPDANNEQHDQEYQTLSEDLGESILFTYEIDLTCQIAVELFQRYLDPVLLSPAVPNLPRLPHVSLRYSDNKDFLFGGSRKTSDKSEQETVQSTDDLAWLIYIEIMLHWMVLNGICIRSETRVSLWESLVGDIGYDLIRHVGKRGDSDMDDSTSKISPAFWPLLLRFLNKLLSELPSEDKYDMVNKHLLDVDEEGESGTSSNDTKFSESEYAFAKNVTRILGQRPDLPEENHLRGLGWVDEIHGRFLKLEQDGINAEANTDKLSTVIRRKMKILDYGFTLVKHLDDILYYDPVEEVFTISRSVEERAAMLEQERLSEQVKELKTDHLYDDDEEIPTPVTTIAEMDDDVLLSNETEFSDEKNEGDDIMTQLKKRREQLQSIVASAEQEERFGYRRLPARAKEREARLNYLRERIIPGKTILVLDTNCFIGHIDLVKRLFAAKKWSFIVPLVVVTELDGLRTNPQRLGLVAQQGIDLLQSTLAAKPKQSTSLRIQTSHNNFMNDISIRSEQFVFGESDKNLDDLVLSTCLWWISQEHNKESSSDTTVPVCLVTGDRNLSVKARARDVEVVPVTAIIQLTPKE